MNRQRGLVRLERETWDTTKWATYAQQKPQRAPTRAAAKVGRAVAAKIASGTPSDKLTLTVALKRPPEHEQFAFGLERAIANGRIASDDDVAAERKRLLSAQRARVAEVMTRLRGEVAQRGGRITYECKNIYCALVELPLGSIHDFASHPDVARVDGVPKLSNNDLRGREVVRGSQLEQFILDEYDGDDGPSTAGLDVGVLEHSRVKTTHPGFDDWDNTSTDRIIAIRECDENGCSDHSGWSTGDAHATQVTGLVAGDLHDDQDSNVSGYENRLDRSGYAGEASIHFWRATGPNQGDDGIVPALDDIAGSDIQILNMSISATGDTSCNGETTMSRYLNDLFDAGILTFFASGNNGHTSTTDCVVEEPGAAMGSFVVGGHTNSEFNDDEDDVRSGAIFSASDRGGTSSEGKGRTIIDLTAAACRRYLFDEDTGGLYTDYGCATSYSAPTVTGAATDYVEFYHDEFGTAIDSPGALHAAMLLFGDRQGESGVTHETEFSNLWGAGRMKMRMWTNDGMGGPWQWGSLQTCIDDSQVYTYELNNGNYVSSDVDVIKAVLFFYDRRHEDGSSYDDLDLSLQKKASGGSWQTVENSNSFDDEKERVFEGSVPSGHEWRLRIVGADVTDDDSGCGTNSQRARFTWFIEDETKDSNGTSTNIDPELSE